MSVLALSALLVNIVQTTRTLRTTLIALALALGAFMVMGTHAANAAYPTPGPVGSVLGICTSANGSCTVTVTITDPNGNPLAGVAVVFTTTCGTVSPTVGTTNSQGKASTTFTPGSSCCGRTTITATGGGTVSQTVITTACAPGLPAASLAAATSKPTPSGLPVWAVVLLAGSGAVFAGSALTLMVVRRRR